MYCLPGGGGEGWGIMSNKPVCTMPPKLSIIHIELLFYQIILSYNYNNIIIHVYTQT